MERFTLNLFGSDFSQIPIAIEEFNGIEIKLKIVFWNNLGHIENLEYGC